MFLQVIVVEACVHMGGNGGDVEKESGIGIFSCHLYYLSHFQGESQVRKRFVEAETGPFPVRAEDMDRVSKEALPQLLRGGMETVRPKEDNLRPSLLSQS